MCDYCGDGDKFLYDDRKLGRHTDAFVGCEVGIYGNVISIMAVGETYERGNGYATLIEREFTINYCPMCGKKLW